MHDPRKARPLKPRTISVMVVDSNNFTRGLIGEILRSLNISNISFARNEDVARTNLIERTIDVVLVSWEEADTLDAQKFVRELRRRDDERLRRLPVVLITSGLTRQLVISGRDAGVDEFLARPISPLALRQRLEMVVETPRPFIDCSVYLGPCRRRKNPADYHGARRRQGERAPAATTLIDQDEVAAQTPIRIALAALRQTCGGLRASKPEILEVAVAQMKDAKNIAVADKDHALHAALAAFEAYITISCPLGQVEETVITAALDALEQLAALPSGFTDARNSVAMALGKAIQKKLAA